MTSLGVSSSSQLKTLQEEKKVLEQKLEAFVHSSEEERDRAAILVSEKKARGQVGILTSVL